MLYLPFLYDVRAWFGSCTRLIAKRKACLQPEKTQGYQYLFAVQFFNSYVYRGRLVAGLDKFLRIGTVTIGFAVKFYVKMTV